VAVSELKGKVGAGETATALQPSHDSIVDLIVVNTVKTKTPTESWAYVYMLAEQAGFEPAVGDYPTHAFQAGDFIY